MNRSILANRSLCRRQNGTSRSVSNFYYAARPTTIYRRLSKWPNTFVTPIIIANLPCTPGKQRFSVETFQSVLRVSFRLSPVYVRVPTALGVVPTQADFGSVRLLRYAYYAAVSLSIGREPVRVCHFSTARIASSKSRFS